MSLTLALETLAIQSEFGGRTPAHQLDRLRFLESEFAPRWGAMGAVAAAAFGLTAEDIAHDPVLENTLYGFLDGLPEARSVEAAPPVDTL